MGGRGSRRRRRISNGEDEGNGGEDGTEERDAAWSFVSFSLEKEVEEPWPLPLLSQER